jgi:SAM-dependent methyltransferase
MAQFHFVEDYEAHVAGLLKSRQLDQAMSLAEGGSYREIGQIEEQIVRYAGLQDGMSLIDLGCGSGRLAHVLSESIKIEYLGTDVVQALLDYAKSKCAKNYKFKLHRELSIPAAKKSADTICAFSVFTRFAPRRNISGSTPLTRTLPRRLKMGQKECHVQAKKVQ